MGPSAKRETVEAFGIDHDPAVGVSDPRRSYQIGRRAFGLRPRAAPERERAARQRQARAGEKATPVNHPINRHRDC